MREAPPDVEAAVRGVLVAFADAVDRLDLEALERLFTLDAVMDLPAALDDPSKRDVLRGRIAILDRWRGERPFATRHLVANVAVFEAGEGEVEARSCGLGFRGPKDTVRPPSLFVLTDTVDRLIREEGRWRFRSRTMQPVFAWSAP
jgi:3-phenylpropionate/cinnamic acid dioxygenase small subunit